VRDAAGEGRNIVQVSRWLDHHSPSFNLFYAHLLNGDLGEGPPAPQSETRQASGVGSPAALAGIS
jgi:hypothetical protein